MLVYSLCFYGKLRAENERVNDFNSALQQLTAELLHIMYAAPGVGLAAPQVGVNKRIMVFNDKAGSAPRSKVLATEKVLINPEIIARSAETKLGDEGCLSFPKIYGKVPRSTWIDISYQTITGEVRQERMQGYSAVVFQHEYDHLDGVLLVDRLVPGDKERNRPHLDKLIKRYGPGGVL